MTLIKTGDTTRIAEELKKQVAPLNLEVKTWVELNDFYEKTVELYKGQFGVLQFIILVMVLLSVANSVNMSVFERVGEFGTMMALGNRNRQVIQLIMAELIAWPHWKCARAYVWSGMRACNLSHRYSNAAATECESGLYGTDTDCSLRPAYVMLYWLCSINSGGDPSS